MPPAARAAGVGSVGVLLRFGDQPAPMAGKLAQDPDKIQVAVTRHGEDARHNAVIEAPAAPARATQDGASDVLAMDMGNAIRMAYSNVGRIASCERQVTGVEHKLDTIRDEFHQPIDVLLGLDDGPRMRVVGKGHGQLTEVLCQVCELVGKNRPLGTIEPGRVSEASGSILMNGAGGFGAYRPIRYYLCRNSQFLRKTAHKG